MLSAIDYSELDYSRPKGTYSYPQWAVAVGWTMAAFAAIWIPIVWIYHIIRYGRSWDVSAARTLDLTLSLPQSH